MFFSNVTILFNKYLLDTAGFRTSQFMSYLSSKSPKLTTVEQQTTASPYGSHIFYIS